MNDAAPGQSVQQMLGSAAVGGLSGRQQEGERSALAVGDGVDLSVATASTASRRGGTCGRCDVDGSRGMCSVSSQTDTESADFSRERNELASWPESEMRELSSIYQGRGLDKAIADEVASQFTAKGRYRRSRTR